MRTKFNGGRSDLVERVRTVGGHRAFLVQNGFQQLWYRRLADGRQLLDGLPGRLDVVAGCLRIGEDVDKSRDLLIELFAASGVAGSLSDVPSRTTLPRTTPNGIVTGGFRVEQKNGTSAITAPASHRGEPEKKEYVGCSVTCTRCERAAKFHSYQEHRLVTVLGEVTVRRAYYYCQRCHQSHCPCDAVLYPHEKAARAAWADRAKGILYEHEGEGLLQPLHAFSLPPQARNEGSGGVAEAA